MTHYVFAEKKEMPRMRRERWETFAAFLTFTALVALAGATYGALMRGDVYAEVHDHAELSRFAGMLESSPALEEELADDSLHFTLIAPTDRAFLREEVRFGADDGQVDDGRIVQINGQNYLLQSEAYVVRSKVMPIDVTRAETISLPTANGENVLLSKGEAADEQLRVNGVPVRDRILADNGVIYLVDGFIHPLPHQQLAGQ